MVYGQELTNTTVLYGHYCVDYKCKMARCQEASRALSIDMYTN